MEITDCTALDILLQLCSFRSSFKCLLEKTATINLAFLFDALLGCHDGKSGVNVRFFDVNPESRRFKVSFTTMVDF